jgi:ABC-type branched-subunit amino acid transport system substrate-binding protein
MKPPRFFAVAALSLSCASCSLLVDTNADQCRTDDDCASHGAEFACASHQGRNVCQAPAPCASNQECIDKNKGAAAVCRADGRCGVVLSANCPKLVGSVADSNTVLMGSILPISGASADVGVPVQNSVELALGEITRVSATLPGVGSGPARPLALLECDESDPVAAANHLVTDLGVFGIIGPFSSAATLKVASEVTIKGGALILSPGATAPSLSTLDPGRLVWRTAPSDLYQARAIAALVQPAEAEHRSEWEIGEPTPTPSPSWIRVALIVRGDNYGLELADTTLRAGVIFNGHTAAENGDAYFARRDYGDPTTDQAINYAQITSFLASYHPNIIMLMTGAEGITEIMSPLEANWPTGNGAPPRPWYIMAHGARVPQLLDLVAKDDDLRRRVRGTQGGVANAATDEFFLRYRGQYGASAELFGMPQAYDATYLMAYGFLAGGEALQGSALTAGLRKMSGGKAVSIGPEGLLDTFTYLATGRSIDVSGASGPLDFDPEAGEAAADVAVWCVKKPEGGLEFDATGLTYSAIDGKLSAGTYAQCD